MFDGLRRWRAAKRVETAEERFFDAYGHDGPLGGRPLVVPLDLFARPRVRDMLVAWAAGEAPLDHAMLKETWSALREDRGHVDGTEDVAAYHRNVEAFVALAAGAGAAPDAAGRRAGPFAALG